MNPSEDSAAAIPPDLLEKMDDMDCRPLGRATGVVTPPEILKLLRLDKDKETPAQPSASPKADQPGRHRSGPQGSGPQKQR
jgi:hypothetical protein